MARREALNGVYDIHTNMMHYPQIMQPTHARWEQVFPKSTVTAHGEFLLPNETQGDDIINVLDDAMNIDGEVSKSKTDTNFSSVPPVISRNYMVADTYFTGPPQPDMPYPGPDGDMYDIGPRDLTHVTQDVIDELDDYCKTEFHQARIRQIQWKEQWRGEREDGARSHVHISYNS